MDAQIVITGLCGFNNIHNHHDDIVGPSVILVRTDTPEAAARAKLSSKASTTTTVPHLHIAYIGFDTTRVTVDKPGDFEPVRGATFCSFRRLEGYEVTIDGVDPTDLPVPDSSYDTVLQKDNYWPEATNQWNHDFVPKKDGKPKKSAVIGFMRFGAGKIFARRPCPFKWRFEKADGGVLHEGKFAEEVVYAFKTPENSVVVRMKDIESGTEQETFVFSPKDGQQSVTLFIGNNDVGDMDNAFRRLEPDRIDENQNHFALLNAVANVKGPGPIPKVVQPKNPPPSGLGGGGVGGVCGPINTNSKPGG